MNLNKPLSSKLSKTLLIIIFLLVLGYAYCIIKSISLPSPSRILKPPKIKGIEKFASQKEFKTYLREAELGYGFVTMGARRGARRFPEAVPQTMMEEKGAMPERVSKTTVQVRGIDEPDIVKTDGKEIYFSQPGYSSIIWRRAEFRPPPKGRETKIIKAFPPSDLAIDSKIDERGDLLLYKNTLVVFSGDKILSYDVSDPRSPDKKWTIELEDKNYIMGARLYQGKIYLITRTKIDIRRPCPIQPLKIKGVPLEIKCTNIYHPIVKIPVDITYSAMVLNPDSGEIENTVSFVGSANSSVVYMSENGIFVTYTYYEDLIKVFTKFLKEKGQDLIPSWIIEKLEKVQEYDISGAAKFNEIIFLMERFFNTLRDDERLRIENELENRAREYFKEHKRDLQTTGIVRINIDKFEISATGKVPGRPLNQFSLDEYQTYLRIASTVGGGLGDFFGVWESANDVYVLDKDLEVVGSIKGLGLRERIYSVRFIEDKGYIVTFRRIDPFFVLDLSNPEKPELKGELKIPGYSSYLHPITKDKILGIGKEGSKVKISLFDVFEPNKPTETDKYTLDEYWSDILETHHAFLLDKKHKIFFLPGRKGGYVFSYAKDELELVKAVSKIRARRAVYINDYLYIIGDNKISILNELNWKKVNELIF